MRLLRQASEGDVVTEMVRSVRVRSTIYCRSELRAPWGFGTDGRGTATFHVVMAGQAWLEVEGHPGRLHLQAGDFVVLPGGGRHWLRDDPETPARPLEHVLAEHPVDGRRRLRHGGDGPRTTLLCGGFALEGGQSHPVLALLPPVIHIRGVRGRPLPWVAVTLRLLGYEAASVGPGGDAMAARLADMLLTQALRVGLAESAAGTGREALRDPRIAATIHRMHDLPQRRWTLDQLAAEAALSRSAFAARFRTLVGEPPMRYLARARLARGASLLQSTDAGIAEVARRAGYDSQYSFSRAFKRAFGMPPGAYRTRADLPTPRITV